MVEIFLLDVEFVGFLFEQVNARAVNYVVSVTAAREALRVVLSAFFN